MKTINLINYRTGGSKIFSGRDKGIAARKELELNKFDGASESVEVLIPKDTWSINSSFFGGLFEKSIISLKEKRFLEKYKFEFDDKTPLTEELWNNIKEGIFEALNEI